MLAAFLTACGSNAPSGNEDTLISGNALRESIIILVAGAWPDNEYTANIPQPESGMLLRGWTDPAQEYCYIELSDFTKVQSEQYVNALKEVGFSEIEKISEEISDDYSSAGTLLAKGSVTVGIAYGDDLFKCTSKTNSSSDCSLLYHPYY